MTRRKTHEEFIKEVNDIYGDEYSVLEDYKGAHVKITIRHNTCGKLYKRIPSTFLRTGGCKYCGYEKTASANRITTEQFKQEIFEMYGYEYELLSDYVNSRKPVLMRHNKCGNEWNVSRGNFIGQRTKCPICQAKIPNRPRKTHKQFLQELKTAHGDEYIPLESYKTYHEKILMKHKVCGTEFKSNPSNLLSGTNLCPACTNSYPKNTEDFKSELFCHVGDEYNLVDGCEYKGRESKVSLMHTLCGHVWDVSPHAFVNGESRCPNCNESKGEKQIKEYLLHNNISFLSEYKFDDCKNKQPLPFDFAVFNNGKLDILIEYDGEQHFEPIEFFGGQERFKLAQHNDNIKNQYCKDNNIPLLRIPYWEFDYIEEILSESLSELLKAS